MTLKACKDLEEYTGKTHVFFGPRSSLSRLIERANISKGPSATNPLHCVSALQLQGSVEKAQMAELDLHELAQMLGRVKLQPSLPRRLRKPPAHLPTTTLKVIPVSEWAQCISTAHCRQKCKHVLYNEQSVKPKRSWESPPHKHGKELT